MQMRWREWGVTALAWIAVLGLGSMALAGAESGSDDLAKPDALVRAQGEEPGALGAGGEGHAVENHGRCVSTWVHRAKDEGLKGKAKGAFISSIAQDEAAVASKDEVGATCDFADELEAALAEQGTQTQATDDEGEETTPRGKSDDAPGKNKAGDDDTGDEGSGAEGAPEESEDELEVPLDTEVSEGVEG